MLQLEQKDDTQNKSMVIRKSEGKHLRKSRFCCILLKIAVVNREIRSKIARIPQWKYKSIKKSIQ